MHARKLCIRAATMLAVVSLVQGCTPDLVNASSNLYWSSRYLANIANLLD